MTYAEEVNYWKSGQSAPDTWLDKTKKELAVAGGKILAEGYGSDANSKAAYMLGFELDGQQYKIVWPVLPSKSGNTRAAKIQAATMLYHDVKAKCVSAKVLGNRAAFFSYLLLPNGRNVVESTLTDALDWLPVVLGGPKLIGVADND